MHDYEFRLCRPEEAAEVFRLICERTRWMDEVGICQWNHRLSERLPIPTMKSSRPRARSTPSANGRPANWPPPPCCSRKTMAGRSAPALYIHNLVGAPDCPGAGKDFRRTEEMALRMGKRYLRLDSTRDNEALGLRALRLPACRRMRPRHLRGHAAAKAARVLIPKKQRPAAGIAAATGRDFCFVQLPKLFSAKKIISSAFAALPATALTARAASEEA